MLPGECAGVDGAVCDHDGGGKPMRLKLKVCQSAAGYYLGYWCPVCGPYSRESSYFRTREDAEQALEQPEQHTRI